MKVSRDKAFEKLCKLEKGKISGRLSTIRKQHRESEKMSFQSVTQKIIPGPYTGGVRGG